MKDNNEITDEGLIKKGKMKKHPILMTEVELKTWKENMKVDIRQHLFSIGQPLVYEKDGVMIAEYSDGRIKNI